MNRYLLHKPSRPLFPKTFKKGDRGRYTLDCVAENSDRDISGARGIVVFKDPDYRRKFAIQWDDYEPGDITIEEAEDLMYE